MKRAVLIAILIVGLTAAHGYTQMSHQEMMGSGMMGIQGQQQAGETPVGGGCNPYQMMGPCMMGCGMGRGMMGCGGHMTGPGMMGCGGHMMGYGMGRAMMDSGTMGQCGMMGYPGSSKEYNVFLDETRSLRKELHMKKFEYSEALRDPETKRERIIDMEKEIRELQNEIHKKSLK